MNKTPSEWLRELGAFIHANGHPFDGDELEEIASQITFLYGETDRLRQVNVDFARTIGGLSTSLTALRQAAEAARDLLAFIQDADVKACAAMVQMGIPLEPESYEIQNRITPALAELRARLEPTPEVP